MEPVRIVIADSNELIREGLKSVFAQEDMIEVVGEVDNGSALVKLFSEWKPDVVLIDYMATSFRTEDIKAIHNIYPDKKFVAITEFAKKNLIQRALEAGISGHVLKSCSKSEIVDSIKETHIGKQFFCGKILNELDDQEIKTGQLSCDPISLSSREIEIIREIAQGKTNKQIAEELHLSAHTVMTHRKNIMNKLGINNTAGIVIYAVRENLISPNRYLFNS